MSRKHLFVVVVMLGAGAFAGLTAATRTVDLSAASATSSSNAQIAAKARSLNRLEASLQRSLAKKPPALPSTPKAASSAPRTVYVRASTPSAQTAYAGEHEYEHEGGLEGDD